MSTVFSLIKDLTGMSQELGALARKGSWVLLVGLLRKILFVLTFL
jgi:hypothetical protein